MNIALFDFDGTIADSMERIHQGVRAVFHEAGIPPPSLDDYALHFGFPCKDYFASRGVPFSEEEIWDIFLLAAGVYDPDCFADAVSFIQELEEINVSVLIITANSEGNVSRALAKAGLERKVTVISTHNKATSIRRCVEVSSLGAGTPYFGDICHDMKEAVVGGATPVAVLRNGHMKHAHAFTCAGAKICIPSFEGFQFSDLR